MNKYKVGDKVYICNVDIFTIEYIEKIVTISEVCKNIRGNICYKIEEDCGLHDWTNSNFKSLPLKGDDFYLLLKTGVFIITSDGNIGVVVDGKIVLQHEGFERVSEYKAWDEDYIRYIFNCEYGFDYIEEYFENICNGKPPYEIQMLWEYQKDVIPEVTMEDVYRKFGHKVKIVGLDDSDKRLREQIKKDKYL